MQWRGDLWTLWLTTLVDGSLERGTQVFNSGSEVRELESGFNISEGLASFNQKRLPKWRSSKI